MIIVVRARKRGKKTTPFFPLTLFAHLDLKKTKNFKQSKKLFFLNSRSSTSPAPRGTTPPTPSPPPSTPCLPVSSASPPSSRPSLWEERTSAARASTSPRPPAPPCPRGPCRSRSTRASSRRWLLPLLPGAGGVEEEMVGGGRREMRFCGFVLCERERF